MQDKKRFALDELSEEEKRRLVKFFEILIEVDKREKIINYAKRRDARHNKDKHTQSSNSQKDNSTGYIRH